MSIKAQELPELIAAAVKKAVADKLITDEKLTQLLHHPITIGLVAVEELAKAGAEHAEKPAVAKIPLPIRMGYRLTTLDQLRTPAKLKAETE